MPVPVTRLGSGGLPVADNSWQGQGRAVPTLASLAAGATLAIRTGAGATNPTLTSVATSTGIASSGAGTITVQSVLSGRAYGWITQLGPSALPVSFFDVLPKSETFWSVALSAQISADIGPLDDVTIVVDQFATVDANIIAYPLGTGTITPTLTTLGRAGSQGVVTATLTAAGSGQSISALFGAGTGNASASLTSVAAAPTQGAGSSTPTLTATAVGFSTGLALGGGVSAPTLTTAGVGFAVLPATEEGAGFAFASLVSAGIGAREIAGQLPDDAIVRAIRLSLRMNTVRLSVQANTMRLMLQ